MFGHVLPSKRLFVLAASPPPAAAAAKTMHDHCLAPPGVPIRRNRVGVYTPAQPHAHNSHMEFNKREQWDKARGVGAHRHELVRKAEAYAPAQRGHAWTLFPLCVCVCLRTSLRPLEPGMAAAADVPPQDSWQVGGLSHKQHPNWNLFWHSRTGLAVGSENPRHGCVPQPARQPRQASARAGVHPSLTHV